MRVLLLAALLSATVSAEPWRRHLIDNSSRGADGVRLADVNQDGFPDIATGWEEGGVIRLYRNPGPLNARKPWPKVAVGAVRSPEDAVFADLDRDGSIDVVSSCEGEERTIYVHWAPQKAADYENENRWTTEPIRASVGIAQWMFALPLEIDLRHGPDLLAGSKGPGAAVGWFEAPAQARDLGAWRWHPLHSAGWIMSLIPSDLDSDGDVDILVSDRKGDDPGVLWLENPGPGPDLILPWTEHRIGGAGEEVMFLDQADWDGDGLTDVLAAVRPRSILMLRRLDATGRRWKESRIPLPAEAGTAKAVRAADVDLDGQMDFVFSCERAEGKLEGVMWLSYNNSKWSSHSISGRAGIKFDLVELIDLDEDGDLDVLTCEETENLGVIWYENPAR